MIYVICTSLHEESMKFNVLKISLCTVPVRNLDSCNECSNKCFAHVMHIQYVQDKNGVRLFSVI